MTNTNTPKKTGVTVWRFTKPPVEHANATDFAVIDHVLYIRAGDLTIALYAARCWESMDYHPTDAELVALANTEDGQ